jgi:hypothetical protein
MADNYVLLERIELNASAASVTFSNIPQTGYTDLKLVMSARSDAASVTGYVTAGFNGSTSNFSIRGLYGTGSGTGSFTTPSNFVGELVGNSATASTFSNLEMYIPNYAGSNNKSYSVDSVGENNATTAQATLTAGLWSITTAVSSITFTPNSGNFVSGSTFSLYGVAALGTTPAIAPKANGGNVIATDGTYWYHAFLSSGTFTPQTTLSADVLVVAGGGGAANNIGGGGGAGGLRYFASQSLTSSTSCAITVGAGGSGFYSPGGTQGIGAKGSNSSFVSITATGGGYGANGDNNGGPGGSGGGTRANVASGGTGNQGSYSPVEGYNGSNGSAGTNAGGGGGAGQVGATGTSGQSGKGGDGVNTYSSWATATNTGVSGYYAGGGGAGGYQTGSVAAGAGGSGGGGAGSYTNGSNGNDAVANTGGGGGGAAAVSGAQYAGNGGSGIIIIRYPIAS